MINPIDLVTSSLLLGKVIKTQYGCQPWSLITVTILFMLHPQIFETKWYCIKHDKTSGALLCNGSSWQMIILTVNILAIYFLYMDHAGPFLFQMSTRQIDEKLIVDISKTQLLIVIDSDFPPLKLWFKVISLLKLVTNNSFSNDGLKMRDVA